MVERKNILYQLPLLFYHFLPQLIHQPLVLYLFVEKLEFQDASYIHPTGAGADQGNLKVIKLISLFMFSHYVYVFVFALKKLCFRITNKLNINQTDNEQKRKTSMD